MEINLLVTIKVRLEFHLEIVHFIFTVVRWLDAMRRQRRKKKKESNEILVVVVVSNKKNLYTTIGDLI